MFDFRDSIFLNPLDKQQAVLIKGSFRLLKGGFFQIYHCQQIFLYQVLVRKNLKLYFLSPERIELACFLVFLFSLYLKNNKIKKVYFVINIFFNYCIVGRYICHVLKVYSKISRMRRRLVEIIFTRNCLQVLLS
jgi:hypothetical protein